MRTPELVETGSPPLIDGDVVEHRALDGDQCIGHEKKGLDD